MCIVIVLLVWCRKIKEIKKLNLFFQKNEHNKRLFSFQEQN